MIWKTALKSHCALDYPSNWFALHIEFIAMMIQMLYAAFLSLSIIGIPTVSAQAPPIVRITSGAAPPPDTKCVNAQAITQGAPVAMLVHSRCPTVNDSQLMEIDSIATILPQNNGS